MIIPKGLLWRRCIRKIEQDFLTATSLLEENYTPDNVYRVGSVAAYVLLSRFYLFRGGDEDLDKAIQYAGMAIEKGPDVISIVYVDGNG